ncbi:MAG: penicillin-binding protein 2 [Pseudomonadota bacterium]
MKRNKADVMRSARKISRRGLVVAGLQIAATGALAWRMRELQVEQASEFRLLAEENRINLRLIPPARGQIFDRNGVVLAENEQNYRIVLVREDAGDLRDTLDRLSKLVPLDEEKIEEVIVNLKKRSPFVPVTILDRLTWEQLAQVSANAPSLPGVTPDVGLSRKYPLASDGAHILGYVGPVSDYDLSKLNDPDPLLQIPRFQIGKTGVEAKIEHPLRGKAGTKRIEVNATGRVMRELDREESRPGVDLQLTIDASLQNYAQARLEGEAASAVVIDCETGDLLCIGSMPSFDPNLFVRGISSKDYNALLNNKFRPFRNKAVQDVYPPGSTFKMVTALAALEAGVVGLDETVWCPGFLKVSRQTFHCWKRVGHGHVNLHEALKQSCDTYFYDISQRVGIDKIAEMARKLGLGIKHDLPMLAVENGIAPDKRWKAEARGEDWRIGDTVNASIGQGYVLSSPLQLAVMAARIATGRSVTPRLVKSQDGRPTPTLGGEPLDIPRSHLNAIRRAMFAVSNHRRGTAWRSRIAEDGLELAGKTGTSQVRRITAEERRRGVTKNEDLPWERRDHALFVNFAPYDDPKIAVAVVVEHGGGGSKAAAPIARDITLRALMGKLPPLEAYPKAAQAEIAELHERMAPSLRDFAPKDDTGQRT